MRRSTGNSQTKSVTIDKIVEAIANVMVPGDRPDVFGDAMETCPPDGAYQLACSSFSMLMGRARRSLFPPLAIRYGSPERPVKLQRMNDTFRIMRRALVMFMYTYFVFLVLNAMLMPEKYHLQFFYIALPGSVLAALISVSRDTPGQGRYTDSLKSIDPDRDREELNRKRNLLAGRAFSPSLFPLRSGMDAFTVMMMFFAPFYVALRWFAGDPLPADLSWSGIAMRFVAATLMTLLFVCIRKSNKLAADVFQEEIDALDAARMKPMSA